MLQKAFGVNEFVVNYFSVFEDRDYVRVYEAAIRLEIQGGVSLEHFLVELRVYVYGVFFHQSLSCSIIARTLNSLNFSEKFSEKSSKSLVVVHYEIGLAVADFFLDDIGLKSLLVTPLGYKFAVLHMGFGVLSTQLHSCELGEKAVAYKAGILGLISLLVRHYA